MNSTPPTSALPVTGRLFGPGLPPAGAPCDLTATPDGLHVRRSRDVETTIPFETLTASLTGFDSDRVAFRWKSNDGAHELVVTDLTQLAAMASQVPEPVAGQLRSALRGTEHARRKPAAIIVGLGLALAIAGLLLWLGLNPLAEWAVGRLPKSVEASIGESAWPGLVDSADVVTTGPAVDAVSEIVNRLSAAAPDAGYEFRVTVVSDTMVNAFALPGGRIAVMTGLIAAAESPEEVAGVLSHEMSHVLERHSMRAMARQLGLGAALSLIFGGSGGTDALAREIASGLASTAFSRSQEAEADRRGLTMLSRAQVSPEGLITFFERLSAQDRPELKLFSTHPPSRDRAAAIRAGIASMGRTSSRPFSMDWTVVKNSIANP